MTPVSSDWLLLGLRLLFVVVLYAFLYLIFRVIVRELTVLAGDPEPPRTERQPGCRLVIVEPAASRLAPGVAFPLSGGEVVGRQPGVDIVIDDVFVSAEHASLELFDGEWFVHDHGSTNGTFINGRAITEPTVIVPGDIVQFGRAGARLMC